MGGERRRDRREVGVGPGRGGQREGQIDRALIRRVVPVFARHQGVARRRRLQSGQSDDLSGRVDHLSLGLIVGDRDWPDGRGHRRMSCAACPPIRLLRSVAARPSARRRSAREPASSATILRVCRRPRWGGDSRQSKASAARLTREKARVWATRPPRRPGGAVRPNRLLGVRWPQRNDADSDRGQLGPVAFAGLRRGAGHRQGRRHTRPATRRPLSTSPFAGDTVVLPRLIYLFLTIF